MQTSFYLVVEGVYSYSGKTLVGIKPVRMTQNRPSLKAYEAVVHVILDAGLEIFDSPKVALVVKPSDVALSVEVISPDSK